MKPVLKCCFAPFVGNRPPEKPKFQRDQSAAIAFDGTVVARHAAADGSAEYVHLVFGSNAYTEGQGSNVVDAEFLFLKGRFRVAHMCWNLNAVMLDLF